MVAGLFQHAGYFMGSELLPARIANPRGFFEDREVNAINEEILADVTPWRPHGPLRVLPGIRGRLAFMQRWLAEVPLGTSLQASPDLAQRIAAQVAHPNYCFKDPRFCYTLPVWRPFLTDPLYLCVFRDPSQTAASMVREVREAAYLRNLRLDFDRALRVWLTMYRHVLERHRVEGDWLFVHYDRVVDGSALATIEALVEAPLDHAFPDRTISRSKRIGDCPLDVTRVYDQLLALSAG